MERKEYLNFPKFERYSKKINLGFNEDFAFFKTHFSGKNFDDQSFFIHEYLRGFIYIYRDPRKAFLSQYRRKPHIWALNQKKMSNNYNVKLSNENLLKLILFNFMTWTSVKKDNILLLKYEELFNEIGQNKIKNFLNNNELVNFPVYVKKNKTETLKNEDIQKLFEKYKKQIDYVNNF